MKGMSAPKAPSKTSRNPLATPRLRRICNIPAMPITSRVRNGSLLLADLTADHYPRASVVFQLAGNVRPVDSRRLVPRTDLVLADPRLAEAERRLGRALVKAAVGRAQQRARDGQIAPDQVTDAAVAELPARAAGLTPVINATGVLVHTNLGRAPLSAAAVDAIVAAAGSCDVEFAPAADYAEATGPRTAFILKVPPSNFRIEGFTAAVGVPALAELGVPVVFDIGSGLLVPHPLLPDEPSAATALRDGAALVTASGDKLLGGPQTGLLLGRADLGRPLPPPPPARALRGDKLTLAALEATLTGPVPPVAAALAADPASLFDRAERAGARLAGTGLDARAGPAC